MIAVSVAATLALSGCMQDDPNARAKIGTAVGAVAGAVIGNNVGGIPEMIDQ